MLQRKAIADALQHLFKGRDLLTKTFAESGRKFTLDGRLVGDIGEVIAELVYDVTLDRKQRPGYDGTTSDGRNVQIKASFKEHLQFRSVPTTCIGLFLKPDGTWEEVYNGPGRLLEERFGHWKDFGQKAKSLPIAWLRELNEQVPPDERVPLRT